MIANKRKMWMASRNIRAIPPWKLIQILDAFSQASESADWDHTVKDLLEKKGIKKDFQSYADNPGGDRTYLAQLICLGFVYKDGNKIQFTKAGRAYLNDHSDQFDLPPIKESRQKCDSAIHNGLFNRRAQDGEEDVLDGADHRALAAGGSAAVAGQDAGCGHS